MMRDPAVIRWVGFAGSVALGIDAYLFGALYDIPVHVTPQSVATGHNGIMIMLLWLGGTGAMAAAWWSGRYLVTSTRWVAVTASMWMLPMLLIPPLASRDVYAYACQGALYGSGLSPYTHGVSDLPCPWLDTVSVVWRDTPTPYGPVFVMLTGVAARTGSLITAIVIFRLLAVIGVALIALALPPLIRRLGLPVEKAMWTVLACPLVVVHLIGGGHNDALTIGLLVAAVAVIVTGWDRMSRLWLGGALIGLSIAIKPTILVAVPFLALYAAEDPFFASQARGLFGFPPLAALVRRGGSVLAGAFLALLIPTRISGLGFGWVNALMHAGGSPSWTSPSTSIGTTIDWIASLFGAHINVVPAARTVGVVGLVIALLLIFWRCRHDQRFYGAGLALLAITFFAPIAQPWYLIWPLVMFVMTPLVARWFFVAVVVGCFVAMPNGVGLDGLLRLPLSMVMAVLAIWALIRSVAWVRGAEPARMVLPSEPSTGMVERR
jgi:alpha-1,6-mannosyltransferase